MVRHALELGGSRTGGQGSARCSEWRSQGSARHKTVKVMYSKRTCGSAAMASSSARSTRSSAGAAAAAAPAAPLPPLAASSHSVPGSGASTSRPTTRYLWVVVGGVRRGGDVWVGVGCAAAVCWRCVQSASARSGLGARQDALSRSHPDLWSSTAHAWPMPARRAAPVTIATLAVAAAAMAAGREGSNLFETGAAPGGDPGATDRRELTRSLVTPRDAARPC